MNRFGIYTSFKHREMAEHSYGDDDNYANSNTDDEYDEIDNFQCSPTSSPVHSTSDGPVVTNSSDEMVARLIDMGFSEEMIARAIEETKGAHSEPDLIIETLVKYSTSSVASSSKSKTIDLLIAMGFSEESVIKAIQEYGDEDIDEITNVLLNNAKSSEASSSKSKITDLIAMGFPEELVIKAVQEYGDENIDEITNGLLSYPEIEKLRETEDEDITFSSPSDNNDDDLYSGLFFSDEEDELNSSPRDSRLRDLVKMEYSRDEAAKAIERCGNPSLNGYIWHDDAVHDEEEARISSSKKRRTDNEPAERGRKRNTTMVHHDELVRLPKPMIGFGVPTHSRVLMHRPVPIPDVARGPPYFYYENVAMAPKGVWDTITRHFYGIMPEFVDSKHFCAAARKRGYIHNLPIKNRFQIQPPQEYTIHKAFPMTKSWWPTWDGRTKLNCLLTWIGSAKLTSRLRTALERYDREPPEEVQKHVMRQCKKWNLVWVGKNKLAPLEPDEMEKFLGFPRDHTRGVTKTDRYKSLGNAFQVDTVAYHLSVLKPLFPNGIKVLSLFSGIGGGEVALHRLQIPMKVVVSVEI
ncbi:unnamed protein product [Arabis nemorensis]|uniref:SAM-dependent MTase DRM-type domain-containing protein n=1 Tax=Arabis nemorensis TaxID=586526 RepID=A0A565CV26_9BRAS|nr:unnamed protein product [Arabis nemorensis]